MSISLLSCSYCISIFSPTPPPSPSPSPPLPPYEDTPDTNSWRERAWVGGYVHIHNYLHCTQPSVRAEMLMSLQQQTSCCKHNLLWRRRVDIQPRGSQLFGGGAKIMAVMTYKILAGTSGLIIVITSMIYTSRHNLHMHTGV